MVNTMVTEQHKAHRLLNYLHLKEQIRKFLKQYSAWQRSLCVSLIVKKEKKEAFAKSYLFSVKHVQAHTIKTLIFFIQKIPKISLFSKKS